VQNATTCAYRRGSKSGSTTRSPAWIAERGVLPVVRFTPTSQLRFRPEDVERLACLGGHEEAR
jgi:hypothetical protein